MSDLTLYTAVPSRGLVVHWMLEELGVDYTLKILELDQDQHKTPQYLDINPLGKVPALVHNDVVVTETAAICLYLAEQFGDKGLNVPTTSPLRGAFLKWMFFCPVTVEPAIISKMVQIPQDGYQPFADLDDIAATIQAALKNKTFIVGNTFTAADVMLGGTLNWGLHMVPVFPRLPELMDYWSRLEARPAWQTVAAQLG